jgi:hypothetical protein
MVKAFKQLELLVLRHSQGYKIDLTDLVLGPFLESILKAADSITTLLLCIPKADEKSARATLSILFSSVCIYRHFKTKTVGDASTIVDPYSGTKSLDELQTLYFCDSQIDRFFDKFLDPDKIVGADKLFMYSGNANSPNSGHSSVNYLADVAGLLNSPELYESVLRLAGHFRNGEGFKNIVTNLQWYAAADPVYQKQKIHSRLVTFTAPGGKSRIIAVADWVSQTALSAIHKTQFQFLQQLPADRTFDHRSGLDIVEPDKFNYYSIDLSAATDRRPRVLQARLIARLFHKLGLDGEGIARDWLAVVDRSYHTRNSSLASYAKEIRYEVGQGMGLFSSWSSMAILHHYIVSELCHLDQKNYSLVGDDLLIKSEDRSAFDTYLRVMEEIGVKVNLTKTLVSESKPHSVEFARNYFILGHRIHPIPIGVVFAYFDGDASASEVFWNFTPLLDFVDETKLLEILSIKDKLDLHLIAYYLYKKRIYTYEDAVLLLTLHASTLELSQQEFDAIILKAERTRQETPTLLRTQLFFIETLLSQCTMRRAKDLKLAPLLVEDFAFLTIEGEEFGRYSEAMRE